MIKSVSKNKIFLAIILHFPVFVALYTIPFLTEYQLLNFKNIPKNIPYVFERWLIWVIPAIILIKVFEKEMFVSLKEMFLSKVKLKTFLWWFIPIVIYLVGGSIASHFGFRISGSEPRALVFTSKFLRDFGEEAWGCLIIPAIPEEIVFRAWIQNALMGKLHGKKKVIWSLIISNLLFAIVHLPVYILLYKYSIAQILINLTLVFLTGCLFGTLFYKTKNIVLPIFLHWFWDVMAFFA